MGDIYISKQSDTIEHSQLDVAECSIGEKTSIEYYIYTTGCLALSLIARLASSNSSR
jgi:hypothetical protein